MSGANSLAVQVRVEFDHCAGVSAQVSHDMRAGAQPAYVVSSRTTLNRVVITPGSGPDLRDESDRRRSLRPTQRAMMSNACVGVAGIITFGHAAQPLFERLSTKKQDAAYREVAEAVASRLGTTLTGLVVHCDESAPHAHFQLVGYCLDGTPVSAVAKRGPLRDLQTLAATIMARHAPGIERGRSKVDRLKNGATPAEVVHRSVAELHDDLPFEIEAKRAELAGLEGELQDAQGRLNRLHGAQGEAQAALMAAMAGVEMAEAFEGELQAQLRSAQARLATNEDRERKARAKAEAEEARAARAAKDAKNAETYARRAEEARHEVERLGTGIDAARERLAQARLAQAEARAAQATAEAAVVVARQEAEASTQDAQARLKAVAAREAGLAGREVALLAREARATDDEARLARTLEHVERGVANLDVAVRLAQAGTHDDEVRPQDMADAPDSFAALRAAAPAGRPTRGFRARFWSLHFKDGSPLPLPDAIRSSLSRAFDRVAAWAREVLADRAEAKRRDADLQAREKAAAEAAHRLEELAGREAGLLASCTALSRRLADMDAFDARAGAQVAAIAADTVALRKREAAVVTQERGFAGRVADEVGRLVGGERRRLASLVEAATEAGRMLDRLGGLLTSREAGQAREARAVLGQAADEVAGAVDPARGPVPPSVRPRGQGGVEP